MFDSEERGSVLSACRRKGEPGRRARGTRQQQQQQRVRLKALRWSCMLLFALAQVNSLKANLTETTTSSTTNETIRTTSPPEASPKSSPSSSQQLASDSAAPETGKIEVNITGEQQPSEQSTSELPTRLRPSIEEVASELSKKHLNLEHENWRLKQPSGRAKNAGDNNSPSEELSTQRLGFSSAPFETSGSPTREDVSSLKGKMEAEEEIRFEGNTDSSSEANKQELQQPNGGLTRLRAGEASREHYLHIDSASGAATQPTRSAKGQRRKKQQQQAKQAPEQEDNELYQCHQFLQKHSSSSSSAQQVVSGFRFTGQNQLPCSCETRPQTKLPDGVDQVHFGESHWLSCDHVQLIISHFYDNQSNSSGSSNSQTGSLVQRFSQRDSGLQSLHSQKFHHLLLWELRQVDLANNRLRQIKMDAFHGLEEKLEFLDLSNNLLGVSRLVFEDADQQPGVQNSDSSNKWSPNNSGGKFVFVSDELNRLKRLRWLSLRGNQISALSKNIFHRPPTSGNQMESELILLDLSENSLKTVPSDSIRLLNKLQVLNLRGNKISQLDQFSKFPRGLKYLDLSENMIKTIKHSDLIDLTDLLELNLSHNQLSRLDKTAFVSSAFPLSSSLAATVGELSSALPSSSDTLDHRQGSQGEQQVAGQFNGEGRLGSALIAEEAGGVDRASARLVEENNEFINSNRDGQLLGRRSRQRRESKRSEEELSAAGSSVEEEGELEADESSSSNSFASAGGRREQVIAIQAARLMIREEHFSPSSYPNQQQPTQINGRLNSTRRLNLSHNLFEQIPGDFLLKFTNLLHLDLSFNRIRNLDSNYLCSIYNLEENLREIDLSGNLLSVNNFTSGDNARHLNRLFGCLQKLEKLRLSKNRLGSSAGTSHLSSSETFAELEEHPANEQRGFVEDERLIIKFGDSFGNKNLNSLDLSDNQLKRMPLIEQFSSQPILPSNKPNKSRRHLEAEQQLVNEWLSSKTHLQFLNLAHNSLDRLDERDFEHLFNLRKLMIDYNKLTNLPLKLMNKFSSLEHLSLEGNQISSLLPLNELIERSVSTLRHLNLAYNRIPEWPKVSKLSALDASLASRQASPLGSSSSADDTNGLKYHHQQQSQPILPFALEELNLEGNLLSSGNASALFDQMTYMRSLRRLNLSYNLINRVRSEWFKFTNKNLRHLSLTGNKINLIDLGSFVTGQVDELISLELNYNVLKELKRKTFDSMAKIEELNLGNNLIHTINTETFYQINTLKVLKLNNNRLSSWKCEYFSHLCNSISGNINADLSSLINSNPLEQSQPVGERQASVSSLLELDLSHNSLSQLRGNSISVHTKLTTLDLSHNKLSFIPHDLFRATAGSSLASQRQIQLVSSLKFLNLAHNRIQTIDNINFRPLRNLLWLDLSSNELQTLGVDVVAADQSKGDQQRNEGGRRYLVGGNLTSFLFDDDSPPAAGRDPGQPARRPAGQTSWPALNKLRHLKLANNQLTSINQSLLAELSPLALLNLDLSNNYLDSEALPQAFYAKVSSSSAHNKDSGERATKLDNYDMVFTLKLESLNLSRNRLNEFPTTLLDNHYTSMESCDLSHNRIHSLNANSNPMIQLKSIDLAMNPLSRESNELILFELKSARVLNLAATRLYAIQQVASTLAAGSSALEGQHSRLRLANRSSEFDLIRSISKPIEAPFLRHLNLSSNQLVWLAANVFQAMHSLETLDLSNNQLTRLHLLNNQLAPVASTLNYLNLNTNLFTNLDSNDFSQLAKLQYLDLSNLLSLQKLNCRFLSKLTSLKSLKLFNYPQLRINLNTLLSSLTQLSSTNNKLSFTQDKNDLLTERMQRKIKLELLMATLGPHCFREQADWFLSGDSTAARETSLIGPETSWLDLAELDLELLNDFSQFQGELLSSGFKMKNQLNQFIGPSTRKITLFGLNLTQISDSSLLGITGNQLELKISYSSLSQVPLGEILSAVPKSTKLELDFRNNNIQSVDTNTLQLLDELQLKRQLSRQADHPASLRLSANPIKCDCRTRPLWLWLNQGHVGQLGSDTQTTTPNSNDDSQGSNVDNQHASQQPANTGWLANRFNSIAQATSDIRCYYPAKLRGKLAQHVFYNDLVCKSNAYHISSALFPAGGLNSSAGSGHITAQTRQLRAKKNETTAYSILTSESSSSESGELESSVQEEDYLDLEASAGGKLEVRLTKFNRFPSQLANTSSFYFLANAPIVPFIQDSSSPRLSGEELADFQGSRIGKRDQNSAPPRPPAIFSNPTLANNYPAANQPVNVQFNKHRPNSQQRHAHYNTLNTFDQIPLIGKSSLRTGGSNSRHSLLTDSDVMILTVISVAMSIMSFVIISVCLFKHKLDRKDKDHMVEARNKLFMAHAIHLSNPTKMTLTDLNQFQRPSATSSKGSSSSSKKSSSSSKHSKKSAGSSGGRCKRGAEFLAAAGRKPSEKLLAHKPPQRLYQRNVADSNKPHVLIPIGCAGFNAGAPTMNSQNFLMRSPTIRRMQHIAANSADWFRLAMGGGGQPVPVSANLSPKRRLFLAGGTQLSAGKNFMTNSIRRFKRYRNGCQRQSNAQATLLATGCPLHSFKILERLQRKRGERAQMGPEDHCFYCMRLLRGVQQTKVHYVLKPAAGRTTANESASSSELNSSSSSSDQSQQKARSLPERRFEELGKPVQDHRKGLPLLTGSEGKLHKGRLAENTRQDYYIPPSLIEAIAKQVNRSNQEEKVGAVPELLHKVESFLAGQQQQTYLANYHKASAQQQVKTMRTFGVGKQIEAESRKTVSAKESPEGAAFKSQSQLPTVDVDGRFAYQTESQIDSPVGNYLERLQPADDYDAGTTTTTTTTDEEPRRGRLHSNYNVLAAAAAGKPKRDDDIFILIQDHQELLAASQARTGERYQLVRMDEPQGAGEDGASSRKSSESLLVLGDECSRSSTPVAYGFMRSSPSNTTISSHNPSSARHPTNDFLQSSPSVNKLAQEASRNNNNDNDYLVAIKGEMRAPTEAGQQPPPTGGRDDEPVVISRL